MTRREARELLFELIFESGFRPDETSENIYYTAVQDRDIAENDYVKNTYFGVFRELEAVDATIEKHSIGWKASRLNNVSRSILRLSVYEMVYCDDIPYSVSISEAVELTKKFEDEKARAFVNGVLNAVKETLEKDGSTK